MMTLMKTIVSPGLAGVDVAKGRPEVFKPENDNELQDDYNDDKYDDKYDDDDKKTMIQERMFPPVEYDDNDKKTMI